MKTTIELPDEWARRLKRRAAERDQKLKDAIAQRLDQQLSIEMAFALYERGLISLGGARRLAKLEKWAFLEGLADRRIEHHYGEMEFDEDSRYAKTSG